MRRVVSMLFALAAVTSPLAAQTHPDFTGKWTLDTATAQGQMAPQSMTLVVTQDPKLVKIESAATTQMGEQKVTTLINLDGTPSKNTATTPNGPLEMTSTGAWDKSALVVTTTTNFQGQPVQYTDRWSLDNDGKALRLERSISISGQSFDVKLTFAKQP